MDARVAPATDKLVVDVAFPFTLTAPKYGPSRPFIGDHAAKAAYVDALEAELDSLDDEVRARPVSAVRLSGGASIMNADKVCHLVRRIKKTLRMVPGAEISIEVEPLTVCTPSLTDWTSCGITRVNLAALSCDDAELNALGARHSREQLQNALLFIPEQTAASWKRTLLTVVGVDAPCISVRPLVDAASDAAWTAQVGTDGAPQGDASSPDAPLPSPNTRCELYLQAQRILGERGYAEIAPGDFVKSGLAAAQETFSRLMRAGADVLGLGAGARSRLDGFLYENACDYDLYVAKSADFEAIVRNPLREDEQSLRARVCAPIEDLTASQRFDALEATGASLAR